VKTDSKNAVETVDRIRQTMADALYKPSQDKEIHVTMSFGIAEYGVHAKQLDALIQKADKALYRAKENGRNRVELF
jgi:diguanylate cyclase (GGDEF)-like protein